MKQILTTLTACLLLCGQALAESAASRPNIIFIMADDLGYTDVACYGSKYYETPHIDRLATQGVKFTNHHHCQNCTPTRAALRSGQYGARTGVYTVGGIDCFDWNSRPLRPVDNVTELPLDRDIIAKQLKAAGYATGMFGKWHIGQKGDYLPGQRGFDEAIVSMGVHFDFPTNPKTDYPKGTYLADFLTDKAVDFITRHKDHPFFLYLPHFGVHSPHQAKADLIAKFKPKPAAGGHNSPVYAAMIASVDESVGRVMKALDELKLADNTVLIFTSDNGGAGGSTRGHWGRSYQPNTLANLPELKPSDYLADVLTAETVKFIHAHKSRPFLVVLSHYLVHNPVQPKPELVASYANARKTDQNNPEYAAMVESLDQSVGRIMEALEQEGLTENTIVVFTSDNGGLTLKNTSNYPLMGGKSFPFEAGMRVPLVIRWPSVIKPGTSCEQRVIGMDFYPTFLAAAGLPLMPQQHADGVSLLPVLFGGGKLPERPLIFHFPHYTHATGPNSVLVENDWKLIRLYNEDTGRNLLYNLAEDPFEQHDLSAAMPDQARTLDERLTRLLDEMKAQMPQKNPAFDPKAKRLMNRKFTLDLAQKEREAHAARIKVAGLTQRPGTKAGAPP
jgi:arylsulfatase A-like enzyme